MKWRWLIGVPLFLVGGGCGALMGLTQLEARDLHARQRDALAKAIEQHGDAFRADLRVASSHPSLAPIFDRARAARVDGKDAGPLLAERAALPLLPEVRLVDDVVIGKFPARALAFDVSGVDVSWLKALSDYDRWELVEERPVRFHHMALPKQAALTGAARVRLLQGLAGNDLRAAAEDVEHLARLAAASEHRFVVLMAPNLLQLVRQTWEHARAEGLDVTGWEPADIKVTAALRRAMRVYPAFSEYHVDPALHGDLWTAPDAYPGRCAALNEAAVTLLEIEGAFGRNDDLRAWLDRALEATAGECRLVLAREAWNDPAQRALAVGADAMCDANDEPGSCVIASVSFFFPGIRDLMIETFADSASGLFSVYTGPAAIER